MTQNDDSLVEGIDYYMEDGFMVFTAFYLKRRGYCCQSGCRHCPYGFVKSVARKSESS
jgi:hypothetical protein